MAGEPRVVHPLLLQVQWVPPLPWLSCIPSHPLLPTISFLARTRNTEDFSCPCVFLGLPLWQVLTVQQICCLHTHRITQSERTTNRPWHSLYLRVLLRVVASLEGKTCKKGFQNWRDQNRTKKQPKENLDFPFWQPGGQEQMSWVSFCPEFITTRKKAPKSSSGFTPSHRWCIKEQYGCILSWWTIQWPISSEFLALALALRKNTSNTQLECQR